MPAATAVSMIYLAIIGGVFIAWLVLVLIFRPGATYHTYRTVPAGSSEFLRTLQSISETALQEGNTLEIHNGGAAFYPAMIEAIRNARRSVSLECYIFRPGSTADAFIEALAARARAGVIVSVLADAVGSYRLRGAPAERLTSAGCRLVWFRPLRWHKLARFNNRTHREILVVDGCTAFIGGAGIADWWAQSVDRKSPWRDAMFRVDGPVAAALQGVFAENWLEGRQEILAGEEFFPEPVRPGTTPAFIVKSSPSDRASLSRAAFQLLIDGAEKDIKINTPYFLPDESLRRSLVGAVRRGICVRIVVPGPETDQRLVRLASRRLFGDLLAGGVRLFEYQRAMMHAKALIVDDLWALVGTTNIDNRSFQHNDEVNLAILDPGVAARLGAIFEEDLSTSSEVALERWQNRSWIERAIGRAAWVLERQK